MEFNLIIILVCSSFAGFLIFKEFKRNDKSKLIWRLVASVLMVACFALIIIPISYLVKKQEPAGVLNLLTAGTALDTIATIKETKYDLDSTLFPIRKNQKINHLADLAYYLKEHPTVKRINIYGYGLGENELKTLKDKQVSFHPSNVPSGVISASWQKKLKATESLKVEGVYYNGTKATVKLKLYGMGTSLDSVSVKPHAEFNFSFVNQPKQVGKAVFNLIALEGNDTLSVEPVPFEVELKQPIHILILASFPDFEYKFLKKWLYENQYAVALRSQISKNKYSTDFLNMKAVNVNQLNQSLLKKMDLVIIDEDELAAIPAADRASIYNAVDNGMGLIVRVTNPKPESSTSNFHQYEVPSAIEKPLSLRSSDQLKFSNLSFKQTIFLKPGVNNQALITDETGKIVVNSRLSGMGKILTSTFSSTYQWQLAGKQYDYSSFWSLLFAKSLRKKIESQSFTLVPQFPSVDEKTRLMLNLANGKIPNISIDSVKINPRQNMEIPSEWDGLYWSKNFGWKRLSINQKTENVYFYKKSDWKSAKSFVKLQHTANFVANNSFKATDGVEIEYLAKESMSKWWFFIGFLLTISFLWYEQRFLAKN
ncbi:hypothetical protein EZ428_22995 [Pedobacter frigiditerrae]|uniref:Aerotolerance regulator N-terminal domain-containing protein n=1 Tax=Pedobacter frigiditerrae TaxID=2530452 RepID=A0A4R0MKY8_9SPHI|nr:hypothetical protein [Pedobacter frigiditerrae]TCC87067.1 hypothetical protein EZ428_22995 [Pedobacter frigiditerrae]